MIEPRARVIVDVSQDGTPVPKLDPDKRNPYVPTLDSEVVDQSKLSFEERMQRGLLTEDELKNLLSK